MIELNDRQYKMILLKINELIESNILVAATNLAADQGISLAEAIIAALDGMEAIRNRKRDKRDGLLEVV